MENDAELIRPGAFEPEQHFYPRVLNAQIHPLVQFFFGLSNERIAARYCHLHPQVSASAVSIALCYQPAYFRWGGADLFHAADADGRRRMYVIETNSCPSGQKSMPIFTDLDEQGGYRRLLSRSFMPGLRRRGLPPGELAVVYDKNHMESSGYAASLADLTGEPVHLVPSHRPGQRVRLGEGRTVEVRAVDGRWVPVRALFRYLTQRPWATLPPLTRTWVYNPVLACLAGGRNKLIAAKAYEFHNARLAESGLVIEAPQTIWDVALDEIPLWVERMGGCAVVKNPYSNAGQGVWTLTRPEELKALLERPHAYDRFIVQQLIGNVGWSSRSAQGPIYHVGTMPNKKGLIYVADLRFMVGAGPDGFFPVAVYARRAREPLLANAPDDSWSTLGTNLSKRNADGGWTTETERLLLMDRRDLNQLGLGLDDLIDAYVQTVLAVSAIDQMAGRLVTSKGRFGRKLFRSLNPDQRLIEEILP